FAPPVNCLAPPADAPSGRLLPRGVKLFVDGGGNTTAASLASGRPPRFLFYRQDELDALVERAHAAGLPVAVHAAGDIAVAMTLDAIEHARLLHPALPPRFRIEHAITLKQADIPRLRSLDVVVVTQPEAIFQAGDRLVAAGLAEGVRIAPFRDLLDAGVTLVLSSDSPCYGLSPLWQIWCAAFRRTRSGAVLDDGQALTVEQALRAYTHAGGAALFTDQAGALTPGTPADFVVLTADPRATQPDQWHQLHVEAVYIDGEPVDLSQLQGPPPGRPAALP
ncbi:MAG: amidohydrolase family protein, partial [Dehalococcoidia bacterium]